MRGLVETLDAHDFLAGQLLRGLVFLPGRRIIPTETLHLYTTSAGLWTGSPADMVAACARAVATLRDFGLIHRETTIGLELHPLMQPVLRLIYEPDTNTIKHRLHALHAAVTDDPHTRPHRDTIKALTTEALAAMTGRATT